MGNGTQQVGARFFQLCRTKQGFPFHNFLLLLTELGRQSTGKHVDDQHAGENERITGERKIQFMIRVGKRIVDKNNTDKRTDDAVYITVGMHGNENERHGIHKINDAVAAVTVWQEAVNDNGNRCKEQQYTEGDQDIRWYIMVFHIGIGRSLLLFLFFEHG